MSVPARETGLRRALAGFAIAAFAIGVASVAVILTSDHTSPRGLVAALILVTGWSFAGTGLYAWDRRPENKTGLLMTAIGFTFFFQAMQASGNEVLFAIGIICGPLPYAILAHLLITFPSGRLEGRLQKATVAAAYFSTTAMQAAWAVFTNPANESECQNCPPNPILISGHQGLADAISSVQILTALVAICITLGVVARRWQRSSDSRRRVLGPVVVTGGIAFAILFSQLVLGQVSEGGTADDIAFIVAIAVFAFLPFAFLIGLLRSRMGRDEEIRTALTAENEQLNAELQAKVAELRASRTRIVEAGYEERRRVERDLHDGAQQRLVALTMSLRLIKRKLEADPAGAAALLDEAMVELGEATVELRELARGIHPAVLSDHGLEAALEGLAGRSPVPVEVEVEPEERLSPAVESATYFVVAEALTNVARYARADAASVRIARRNGVVEVEVADDGVGGADPATGSGLRGLADRVAALEGELEVESDEGVGTTVRARIPCG